MPIGRRPKKKGAAVKVGIKWIRAKNILTGEAINIPYNPYTGYGMGIPKRRRPQDQGKQIS